MSSHCHTICMISCCLPAKQWRWMSAICRMALFGVCWCVCVATTVAFVESEVNYIVCAFANRNHSDVTQSPIFRFSQFVLYVRQTSIQSTNGAVQLFGRWIKYVHLNTKLRSIVVWEASLLQSRHLHQSCSLFCKIGGDLERCFPWVCLHSEWHLRKHCNFPPSFWLSAERCELSRVATETYHVLFVEPVTHLWHRFPFKTRVFSCKLIRSQISLWYLHPGHSVQA